MKQKFLNILVALGLTFISAGIIPATAYADCSGNSSVGQVLTGVGQTTSDCTGNGVTSIVGTTVRILSYIVGIAAIIMIIVSGFRYITSGGDSNRVSSAKNTLIYAVIGLAIAVIAQVLVSFVITQSNSSAHNCSPGHHWDSSAGKNGDCVKDS